MTWLLVLLGFVLLLLSYILLAPLYIELDSRKRLFRFRFHRLASARIYLASESLFIDFKIIWWVKTVDLFLPRKKKDEKVKRKKKRRRMNMKSFNKIWAAVKTFKVKKCSVNIDTGDMPLNGIIYPVFVWLSYKTGRTFSINFQDENEIIFVSKNNIARMLWAYTRS